MHLKTDTSAQAHYASVPTIKHSRNAFSIAKRHVTTMQFDTLYPLYNCFIYPGDTLSIQQMVLARLTTQIRTLFDDLYFDAHAWFVPMRLIQTNWARFQFNAQPTGPSQDNSALTTPNIDLVTLGAGGFPSKSLYDYFGYPTKIDTHAAPGSAQWINNYYGRAYNLIWNNNYRDENLQNAVTVDLGEGPDLVSNYQLLKRGKRHDKFTSALTAAQKGTAVTIPLGTSAPVITSGVTPTIDSPGAPGRQMYIDVAGNRMIVSGGVVGGGAAVWGSTTGLLADLTNATAATVNQWRSSIAVQQLLEADARGGTRDVEAIANRWGVTVPDFRLQRPEYIGGTTFSFDGHVVPQSSATGATGTSTPQGNLTMFSQSLSSFNINHSFVEHGVFMILVSARANITYQQGLPRELSYKTRFDFYQPEFANLGEVAIKNKEIYFQGTAADDNTFGYQEYAYELRYQDNMVTGEMRSNYTTSLDSYHLADNYASLPTLSAAWIQSNTAISRNIAVSAATADPIQMNTMVQGKIARTLPMYSVPGLFRL